MAEADPRATIKDVYDIVGAANVKLDALNAKFDAFNVSNEHRFTVLEENATETRSQVKDMRGDVDELKTAHAVARGHIRAVVWIGGAFLTLMAGGLGLGLAHAFGW